MSLIPATITKVVSRNGLLAKKNSPEVLLAAGVVGSIASTVLACRATLKADTLVAEAKEKLATVRTFEHAEYTEADRQRDISLIYVQTSVKAVRLYAPAIVVGAFSVAALIGSNRILSGRATALAAAYTALDQGFREYRARVVEKYGEDEDRRLRYGSRQVEIINPETGRKKHVERVALTGPSIYARFFDPTSPSWNPEPEYNLVFLSCQQNWANDMLRSRGHFFLNEAYDLLGLERSKEGAVVGWLLTTDGSTDNFVDFGVFNGETQQARDFVNGHEGSILLDFNVDGVIYDKI